jgi:hypothetical protein
MSPEFFLYWLKGFIAALESRGEDLTKEDLDYIKNSLDMAIRAVHKP